MGKIVTAQVILAVPVRELFTYVVPELFVADCQPGVRVVVPFGKRKRMTGIVAKVLEDAVQTFDLKEIEDILDAEPLVSETTIKFWEWMASYYLCSPGEVMNAALPAGMKLESETRIALRKDFEHHAVLRGREREVYELLFEEGILTVKELEKRLSIPYAVPVLKRLEDKKIIHASEKVTSSYKTKTERRLRLEEAYCGEEQLNALFAKLKNAPKQLAFLLAFLSRVVDADGQYTKTIKRQYFVEKGHGHTVIKALVDKGVILESTVDVSRLELGDVSLTSLKALAPFQQKAYDEVKVILKKKQVLFLHGVTSSGKTELYAHLAKEIMDQGEQVLYLVPEIALTTQLTIRLKRYFGNKLAVYHSRLSDNERVELWHKIAHSKDITMIVGPRSAQFLPFQHLGMVIVDEEHEASYKQDNPNPRYHGRDSAIMLGVLHKAKVILGSATPSLETYRNSISGKYGYVRLNHRFGDLPLPSMQVIDMTEVFKKRKYTGHISYDLIAAMRLALSEQQQIILFLNRRGYAPFIECKSCGWVLNCPTCDVSLTKHKFKEEMRCHYCGFVSRMPNSCGACGHEAILEKGVGTEQLEEEVTHLFPNIKVGRMDLDTTRGKHGFAQIITAFEDGDIDILIGTQMVSKGLDFDNVGLVGIIQADSMLNVSDFRASERSYQMIEQVAGRSGRKGTQGKVLIQTFNATHPVIQMVVAQSQKAFYEQELEERHMFGYPPFTHIVVITLKHVFKQNVKEAADEVVRILRTSLKEVILGPEPPPVGRIKNQFLERVFIKIQKNGSQEKVKHVILEVLENVKKQDKKFSSVGIQIDVDPM